MTTPKAQKESPVYEDKEPNEPNLTIAEKWAEWCSENPDAAECKIYDV